jgi:hypothetical protein
MEPSCTSNGADRPLGCSKYEDSTHLDLPLRQARYNVREVVQPWLAFY